MGIDGFIYKEVRRKKRRFVNLEWKERNKQSAAGLVQGIRESESIG